MLYFRGASMIATNGATIAPLPDSLADLATGLLAPRPAVGMIVCAIVLVALFQTLDARRESLKDFQRGIVAWHDADTWDAEVDRRIKSIRLGQAL